VNDREVLEVFARYRTHEPVIVWPGNQRLVLEELGHGDPAILYASSLAYAAPTCFGLAVARPDQKVVAIEGDGSLIAGLPHLTTLGRYPLANVVVLVFDNEGYRSTDRGELPTATAAGTDLAAIARGAGIRHAVTVTTIGEAEQALERAFREDGPFVIVAKVAPSPRTRSRPRSTDPDRTEESMRFRRWLIEHGPERPAPRLPAASLELGPLDEQGPGRASARAIYEPLKASGIDLFIYLPDSVTYPVQELAERDREMATLCCAREDEGVAIASGAYYGGLWPALVMEGSGVGYSGLALALSIVRRTPVLLIASHSEALGVRFDHDTTSRMTTEPLLRALGIPYVVLRHIDDAAAVVRESAHAMHVLKTPVGIVIPPHLMADRGLGWADKPIQAGG
jgi:thiamine pyrophosphate-dependent acetolactate synthase large subunit-like protein